MTWPTCKVYEDNGSHERIVSGVSLLAATTTTSATAAAAAAAAAVAVAAAAAAAAAAGLVLVWAASRTVVATSKGSWASAELVLGQCWGSAGASEVIGRNKQVLRDGAGFGGYAGRWASPRHAGTSCGRGIGLV